MKTFKIHSIDNVFCRINYTFKNAQGQKLYYCLQDEGKNYGGVICYRSSVDLEPCYKVMAKLSDFEIPTGDSEIEVVVREYLTKED